MLAPQDFRAVLQNTPLVALDLVLTYADGKVLLGKRRNCPAKGFWFVPGGRIYKNETVGVALGRICQAELGHSLAADEMRLLGVYDHIYEDNVFEEPGFGTHYVVLAIANRTPLTQPARIEGQHSEMRFSTPDEIRAAADVHEYTKRYFLADAPGRWF